MPQVQRIPVMTGCLFVLLCLTCCSSNEEDPNNELDTQSTESLLLRTHQSTRQMSSEAAASETIINSEPVVSININATVTVSPATNTDFASTDEQKLVPVVVVSKSDSLTSHLGSRTESEFGEPVTQVTALTNGENEAPAETQAKNDDASTMAADGIDTFPADQPFVATRVTNPPELTTDNNAHKPITSAIDNQQAYSFANTEPRFLMLVTDIPIITEVSHNVPMALPNISPELDIHAGTIAPTLQAQSSSNIQPVSLEDPVKDTEETVNTAPVTAPESERDMETERSTVQESGGPITSRSMDDSTLVLTSDVSVVTKDDDPASTSEKDDILPTSMPAVPVLVEDETESPSKLPEAGTVAAAIESDVPVEWTTMLTSDEEYPTSPEDDGDAGPAALHPLHGHSTTQSISSSPFPGSQYQTNDPSTMGMPISVFDYGDEAPSTTVDQPIILVTNLSSSVDDMEEDSTTIPDIINMSTDIDVKQTDTTPVEETLIFPEYFPELTGPIVKTNNTNDTSGNESAISMVLEDLTPTVMVEPEDPSVTNESSRPTPARTLDEPNRTHKDSEDLTDDEHSNAVTVIFYVPEPKKSDSYWYEERNQLFRMFVVDALNNQQRRGWPDLYKNNGSFIDRSGDLAKRRRRQIENQIETGLLPEDLVYITPAPLVENRYIYVVFFVKNSSTPDPCDVVLGQKIVHALNTSRLHLEDEMDMNVTRISTGIIMVKYIEPFFVRHALIFIVLLAVAFFFICVIIVGLLYIRCRNSRGNWKRNEFSDEKALKRDMKGSNAETGDVNAGNNIENDEPQMTEKYGNGNHVISLSDDDGWAIPYDDLTPAQKAKYDFEDTKL